MEKRLLQLYRLLPTSGKGIIDVGTDHGQIPVRLAQDGYPGAIYASDIHPGPLDIARKAAARAGVSKRISFLLCDGLDGCPPDQIDCILIAGMGGDTICGILDRAEWLFSTQYHLVLQPMTRPEVLRYWLIHNGFTIDQERTVSEDHRIYQLFSASPGNSQPYRDVEYLIGKPGYGREKGSFRILLTEQQRLLTKKLSGLRESGMESSPSYCFYQKILEDINASCSQLD